MSLQDKTIFGVKRKDNSVHLSVDGQTYRLTDKTAKVLAARLLTASNPDAEVVRRVGGAVWNFLTDLSESGESQEKR